jgi:CheY-like chemotaxis protein
MRVMGKKQSYRLTAKGRTATTSAVTVPPPLDYSNILGILDQTSDPVVIRSYLAGYLAHVVDDWLVRLEANGLIERVPEGASPKPQVARAAPALDSTDPRISFVDMSLNSLGVYIANDRIARRQPARKPLADTLALVLEDDPDQLALAKLRLVTAGYAVAGVDSVQAFYRRFAAEKPDVVFLDVNLPDGNGFDVLATLRKDPQYVDLPVIMVTVRSEPQDIARGLALGADGYVTKPYGRNTLEYVLRCVMKQEVQLTA